jgi:hypothetical protein
MFFDMVVSPSGRPSADALDARMRPDDVNVHPRKSAQRKAFRGAELRRDSSCERQLCNSDQRQRREGRFRVSASAHAL